MLKPLSRIVLAIFFFAAGFNHFLNPPPYLAMIPPYVPFPVAANFLSGAAEMLGGIALIIPRLRRVAAWGLIALLLAVFPANIHIALHGWKGFAIPAWILWARLPFQFALIAWVYWSGLAPMPPRISRDKA